LTASRIFKYGDDINTDVIFPGKYTYTISDPKDMAQHALEDLDPEFINQVKPGDIIVAGKNFGCGSSREQAATCIKMCGVSAVIAKSFARIYYRNAINQGLAVLTIDDVDKFNHNDHVEIDLANGSIKNITTGETVLVNPLPDFIMDILKDGGLIPHLKKNINY
jgi:3-isopropylmalate/(R)-2-methylmalate dehydratase small subunit